MMLMDLPRENAESAEKGIDSRQLEAGRRAGARYAVCAGCGQFAVVDPDGVIRGKATERRCRAWIG